MSGLLTGLALAMAAQAAPAVPEWRPLSEDAWGRYFLDQASVSRRGDIVRFTLRALILRPNADGIAALVSAQELDCAGRTMTTLSGDLYGADGILINSAAVPPALQVREPITAGSAQDRARLTLCAAR